MTYATIFLPFAQQKLDNICDSNMYIIYYDFDHDQKIKDIQRCMYTKIYLTPNIIRKALYYYVY